MEVLKKGLTLLAWLPAIYIVLMASYNGCVTTYYTPREPALYGYGNEQEDFMHVVYVRGNKIVTYRGMESEYVGEYALQTARFEKWNWYFPCVYDKPNGKWIFGVRFRSKDCVPTTMYWQTQENKTVGGCVPHYSDRKENYADVDFYADRIRINGCTYRKIPMDKPPFSELRKGFEKVISENRIDLNFFPK